MTTHVFARGLLYNTRIVVLYRLLHCIGVLYSVLYKHIDNNAVSPVSPRGQLYYMCIAILYCITVLYSKPANNVFFFNHSICKKGPTKVSKTLGFLLTLLTFYLFFTYF